VQTEFDLAFKQKHSPAGKKIIPILYKPCQPREDMTLLQMVSFLEPKPYEQAFDELLKALGLSDAPAEPPRPQPAIPASPPAHVAPPDRFPPRLAELGYRVAFLNGAEVILPPLCDVPAGPFLMGSDPATDKDAEVNEQPQHWVTLGAYQIGKYPVTVAEYACFIRATGRAAPTGEDGMPYQVSWQTQLRQQLDHPVVTVSWRDATAYVQWLAERAGHPWRLPSEAEWKKAARWDAAMGSARIYPWGDAFDASHCNSDEGKIEMTTPVGSYLSGASPYGALDMAGNVCCVAAHGSATPGTCARPTASTSLRTTCTTATGCGWSWPTSIISMKCPLLWDWKCESNPQAQLRRDCCDCLTSQASGEL
jgi:formylglycine-generating enzyme required for sulfatase activity